MRNLPKTWLRDGALALISLVLVGANQAWAACPPQGSRRPAGEDPFQYALALAESFAQAKLALSKAPMEAPGRSPGSARELAELVRQLQSASEDYKCAVELVAGYARSSDESVALSAQAAAVTYGALIQLGDQKRQLTQAVLDGKLTRPDLVERLNRGRAQTEETWRTLISATVMGTFALVVPPEEEEDKVSRLRLSEQQRKILADRLEKEFGPAVREGSKRGEAPLVGAARVLYGFVSNEDWKSSGQ